MTSEIPKEYTTVTPIKFTTEKPSSNHRSQPILYPYYLKRGIQDSQERLQGILILFILYIIKYVSSVKRAMHMHQGISLIISHIRGTYTNCEKLSSHNHKSLMKQIRKRVQENINIDPEVLKNILIRFHKTVN